MAVKMNNVAAQSAATHKLMLKVNSQCIQHDSFRRRRTDALGHFRLMVALLRREPHLLTMGVNLMKIKFTNTPADVETAKQIKLFYNAVRVHAKIEYTIKTSEATVVNLSNLVGATGAVNAVYRIMESKNRVGQTKQTQNNVPQMIEDLMYELQLSQVCGVISQNWFNVSAGLTRIRRTVQAAKTMDTEKYDNICSMLNGSCLTSDQHADAINPILNEESGGRGARQANLYMMDHIVNAAVLSAVHNWNEKNWEIIATFSRFLSIGKGQWRNFVSKNPFLNGIGEDKLVMYDNPMATTADRLMGYATLMFSGAQGLVMSMAMDTPNFSSFFNELFQIEKDSFSDNPQESTVIEHTLHMILVNGNVPLIHFNRNNMTKSYLSIRFGFDDVADATVNEDNREGIEYLKFTLASHDESGPAESSRSRSPNPGKVQETSPSASTLDSLIIRTKNFLLRNKLEEAEKLFTELRLLDDYEKHPDYEEVRRRLKESRNQVKPQTFKRAGE